MTECFINNKYQITDKLGEGRFGSVYKGVNQKTKSTVAIKFENINAPAKLLQHETKILNYLYSEGCRNVPAIFWYGTYGDNLCTVMSIFECSLFDYVGKKSVSSEKARSIVLQCVHILSDIHKKYVIHRDVKPQNIMVCGGQLYFIDFGISTFYVNEKHRHFSDNGQKHELTGTPKWTSVNLHNGHAASRRDDLISLGYVFLFLLNNGSLPWDNLSTGPVADLSEINIDHPKNQTRKDKKSLVNLTAHCEDTVFIKYINYCYDLSFAGEPNYDELNDILENDIKK
jgi:serine/threonine protein kinase